MKDYRLFLFGFFIVFIIMFLPLTSNSFIIKKYVHLKRECYSKEIPLMKVRLNFHDSWKLCKSDY